MYSVESLVVQWYPCVHAIVAEGQWRRGRDRGAEEQRSRGADEQRSRSRGAVQWRRGSSRVVAEEQRYSGRGRGAVAEG
jgi:hypothetical protein